MDNICILIPSYKPNSELLELVKSLKSKKLSNIVIVRDGDGVEYNKIYDDLKQKCDIVEHDINLGKGRALKTGFKHIKDKYPNSKGIVTADADGQHAASDILKVANKLLSSTGKLVLGVRSFGKDVPFRSKFGNNVTKFLFRILVGKKISDTQTGLRGISSSLLENFSKLSGDRYEYELNMLIATRKLDIKIEEVPIQTIYIEDNKSSHFNPIIDSIKIYKYLLLYSLSGITSFLVDISLFFIILKISDSLLLASYLSRASSLSLNFFLNRNVVFSCDKKYKKTLPLFLANCLLSITISYLFLLFIQTTVTNNLFYPKILIEFALFFLNFYIQSNFIFNKTKK